MTHTQNKHLSYSTDELIGRALLKEIIPIIYNRAKYDLATYISDIADTTHYDAFISLFNKETGSHIACHIIEVKVRDIHYDELMFERRKYNDLKNVLKRNYNVADIIYINTTPKGTFIWNISKLEAKNKLVWQTKLCNKSTVEDKGKVDKKVALLPITEAKYIPTITNTYLDKKLKVEKKQIEEEVKEKQRTRCLFEWLLTPSDLKGEIKKNDE